MLWEAIKEQHWLERTAVFFTTFLVPTAFEVLDAWATTENFWEGLAWGRVALYFGTFLFALAVIALSSKVSSARADKKLNRMSSEVEDSINQLQEDHERKITGTQDRVGDLREWVIAIRESIEEQSEMKLPAPRARIRASISIGPLEATATVRLGTSSGWMVRLRTWVDCQAARFHRWFRKWICA